MARVKVCTLMAIKQCTFHSTFGYILSTRFEVQVQHRILMMRSQKSYHHLTDQLAVEAMQLTTPSEQYMFEREKDLDCFQSVFGTTSTFGVWCHGPKVGNPPHTLQHNDMINAILPLGRNEQAASGIKISFNQQVELKISVYYEVYNYTANAAGAMSMSCVAVNYKRSRLDCFTK